jgi:hypothetical protein
MQETIERFYAAFDRRDGDTKAACYAPGARFSDPAFGELRGEEPGAMWRMLTGQATDLRVELGDHGADEASRSGHADWTAHYTFSQTGRRVTNHVRATFSSLAPHAIRLTIIHIAIIVVINFLIMLISYYGFEI